ncbi:MULTISPECIES: TetR/AcrR family transcriptional regulator [unclassified Pseudofrankia]|uniref:TetR/AcrR family transcriptional regulator n=1 Tax=unclassified Pseudofrankia TaxID=2994372 RepID=UPI0008D8FBCF|nr:MULTISPECIES: TetR/AcrR family transcriptional regulator [unclassified Pseudofrankia]MDT3446868.1 helix-turn-helix domain-containing protein [Pseudofrankia sp. BMG5.37]OHV55969.1 hypothetical protein BCD48_44110 [Pseudofrankia sp. BMG5.36]
MSEPDLNLELPPEVSVLRAKRASHRPKSADTERAVLDAAGVLFAKQGYEGTSINDIVKLSGVSVGSIYHRFGGKAEVFMALARAMLNSHAVASREATERARAAGETRPVALYVTGAKAHLIDTWKTRKISRIVLGNDGPPGFASVRREADAKFMHGARGLTIGKPPLPNSSACAVTSLVHAAALQIVDVDDELTATKIADYFLDLIVRLEDQED